MSAGKISKALRFRILARDGFRCRYCGRGARDAELHVDHFIALADGGHSGEENLVTACRDCNLGKSDRRLSGQAKAVVGVQNRRGKLVQGRDARNRSPHLVRQGEPDHHVLNTGAIAAKIEPAHGENQRVSLWCESHQRYEWHMVPAFTVGRVGTLVKEPPPGPIGANFQTVFDRIWPEQAGN